MNLFLFRLLRPLLNDHGGGGEEQDAPQIIPAPEAPDVGAQAKQLYELQQQYNPQLTQQAVGLQTQYAPQLAQSQYDIQAQYSPMYQALLNRQMPQLGTLSGQVSQQLGSPSSLTPEQMSAQEAIRQRSRDQTARNIQTSANIGGGLFGGRRELREDRALGELEQGFVSEDINRQERQRQQMMAELTSLYQMYSPSFNVGTPQVSQFGQGVTPDASSLYNALVQNQSNFGILPGAPATPGFGQTFSQSFAKSAGEAIPAFFAEKIKDGAKVAAAAGGGGA